MDMDLTGLGSMWLRLVVCFLFLLLQWTESKWLLQSVAFIKYDVILSPLVECSSQRAKIYLRKILKYCSATNFSWPTTFSK